MIDEFNNMSVMRAIRERRSVRKYQDKDIPEEIMAELLEAARFAPSAKNLQFWRFIAVKDAKQRKKLAKAAGGQNFVAEAPVVVAGVSLEPERIMHCGVPAYAVDVAIAMTNISLAAAARGIGSCWIGYFDQEEVKKILDVPSQYKVVELMPIGYSEDKSPRRTRKSLEEIISYDRF